MEENDGRDATSKILFGRYEMGRLLGQGTFAKVYHGKHLQTGDSVAIKVLNKDQIRREGLVQQIIREISVMRLVRHPNVVELREVMATKSRIFFAMEYVRGGELFAKVSRGKLKEDDARRYFQQLVSAVDFCHSRGVSHRDLKPENLLLDEKGNLKISDFGLSALPEQLRNDGLLHTQCGTPAYVAPEVLRKKGYDGAKADLWSCGVVLYVLLAGFLPFQDENLMRMYQKVFKAEFQFPPWVSAGAKRLISRLLVAKPENRITIPEIMRDPWFRKGLAACHEDQGEDMAIAVIPSEEETKGESPPFYNAFELISAMSSGFDLSGMFESRGKAGTVFTSRRTAAEVVDGVRRAGRELGFVVNRSRGYKLRLEGKVKGMNGLLVVTVEVFEAAEGVTVAEFCKTAGDALEYAAFCDEVRPGLREVVWTWQGGDRCS